MERQISLSWANPSWWNLLVVLPWAIGLVLLVHQWKVEREIAAREQTAEGVITAHEPANHNRYGYVFSVNGKTFTGWDSSTKDELQIGKPVLVYYDPQDPTKNALTEFGDLSMVTIGPVPTMLLGIGAVAWYIRSRRQRNQVNSDR